MERHDERQSGGLIVDSYSRQHQGDWIVPRRVMCAFFWVGIILLFTGIILLVTSKHKGVVYQSWGAVLLGLGFCLLLICLILCLHAYCVITVADDEDQPAPRRHVAPPSSALLLANGRSNNLPNSQDTYLTPPPNGDAGNGQTTIRRANHQTEVAVVVERDHPTYRAVLSSTEGPVDSPRNQRRSTAEGKTRVLLPTSDSFDNQCTCDINLDKRKSGVLTQALDDVLDDIDKNYGPEAIQKEQETPLLNHSPKRKRLSDKTMLSYDDTTNALQAYDAEQSYRSFNDDVDRSIDKDLNIRPSEKKRSPPRKDSVEQDTPPVRFTDVAPTHGDIQVVPLGPPPSSGSLDRNSVHPLRVPPVQTEPRTSGPLAAQHDGLIMIHPSHTQRPPLQRQDEREGGLLAEASNGPPPSYESYQEQMRKSESLTPSPSTSGASSRQNSFPAESRPDNDTQAQDTSKRSPQVRSAAKSEYQASPDRLPVIREGFPSNGDDALAKESTPPPTDTVGLPVLASSESKNIPSSDRRAGQMTSIGVQYSPPVTPTVPPSPGVKNRPPPGRRQQQTPAPPHPPSRPTQPRAPRLWTQSGTAPHGAAHVTAPTPGPAPGSSQAQAQAQAPSQPTNVEVVPLPDVSLSKISLYDNVQYDMSALKKRGGEVQHFHF